MRGGQSPASERYLPAPGLRQFAASQKSKRLLRAYKTGGKKSKRLSGDHSAFSTEVCCFFLFYCLDDEKPAIDAQTLSSVRKIAALSSRIRSGLR